MIGGLPVDGVARRIGRCVGRAMTQQIDCDYAKVIGKKADLRRPVRAAARESMQQQQRLVATAAHLDVVVSRIIHHKDKSLTQRRKDAAKIIIFASFFFPLRLCVKSFALSACFALPRCTLPDAVCGSSSVNTTVRGCL